MSRSYYRTRIKFCGMTRAGDVRLAGELGVDAVGFIFARESSRRVAPAEARAMRQAIAPMVDVVALFRNNSKEEVREVLRTVRPTLLQFHGEEDESFCRSFNMPYLKAIAMGAGRGQCAHVAVALPERGGVPVRQPRSRRRRRYRRGLRLGPYPDRPAPAVPAGRWSEPGKRLRRCAGHASWGVDVSSGIELEPGIKDGYRMRTFVEEVRRADCTVLE